MNQVLNSLSMKWEKRISVIQFFILVLQYRYAVCTVLYIAEQVPVRMNMLSQPQQIFYFMRRSINNVERTSTLIVRKLIFFGDKITEVILQICQT
jgi:hypothetical protein